jgi:hypothetical protein
MNAMPDLQQEMMELWDDADLLLMSARVDAPRGTELIRKLLACSDRAHDAGFLFGERQLRKAASDLQVRLHNSN